MSATDHLQTLRKLGAVLTEDHFVYTSGQHGPDYVNKDAVYPHTKQTAVLCGAIGERFLDHGVEVVIGPTVGGVILSQWTAQYLTLNGGEEVLSLYADKVEGGFDIKRGYPPFVEGRRTLVVEDVLNTGGSVGGVVQAVRRHGGTVVGVGVLCNRGGVTTKDIENVPELFSLVSVEFATYEAADCPLCQKGVPVNTMFGKGQAFLAQLQKA